MNTIDDYVRRISPSTEMFSMFVNRRQNMIKTCNVTTINDAIKIVLVPGHAKIF